MKVFFGVFMILVGSVISLAATISSLPLIVSSFAALLKDANAHSGGYFVGSIIGFLLFIVLAIFLILKGAKLVKHSRVKSNDTMEEY